MHSKLSIWDSIGFTFNTAPIVLFFQFAATITWVLQNFFIFYAFLSVFISSSNTNWAVEVLEIGTFIGFSTMGWSEAVGPDGHVTALEFSPEYAKIAEESFERNGIKNVEVIVGDARES